MSYLLLLALLIMPVLAPFLLIRAMQRASTKTEILHGIGKVSLLIAGVAMCTGCTRTAACFPAHQLGTNTYAMQSRDFARYMAASYARSTPYIDIEFNNGGNVAGAFAVMKSFDAEQSRDRDGIHGCYNPVSGRIVIAVAHMGQLSEDERLTLIHERAHADDHRLGQEGASPLWRYLAVIAGGQAHLTHDHVNQVLRAAGFKAPK